jgi:hypothetical protein
MKKDPINKWTKAMNAEHKDKLDLKFKHSPAPWREDDPGHIVDNKGGDVITDENHGSMIAFSCGEEGMGDRALCLNAPEMYYTLQEAYVYLNKSPHSSTADILAQQINRLLRKISTKQGIKEYYDL